MGKWTHPKDDYAHFNREYENGDVGMIDVIFDTDVHGGLIHKMLSHVMWCYADSAGLLIAAGSTGRIQQAKDRCDQENRNYV